MRLCLVTLVLILVSVGCLLQCCSTPVLRQYLFPPKVKLPYRGQLAM